ncbi:MAG: LapA family protein [Pseudomonadota bacterium]
MRYIRYALIAAFAIVLIAVALANRDMVLLQLIPAEVAGWFAVNPSVELPLFVVIFGSIIVGLFVGFIWEWVREHGLRADAARQGREKRRLEREVAKLKETRDAGKDEVLVMLDEAS